MAEPGDPTKSGDDFDDQIGFCSPGSIAGRSVEPVAGGEVTPEPAPELDPVSAPWPEPEPQWGAAAESPPAFTDAWAPEPQPEPASAYMSRAERREALKAEPEDRLTWALTLYALILFAVPTMGFSAVVGLLAVTGRTVNASPLLQSHYIYQQRTLWTAAITALAGLILIVVNLGIFVLFLLAVWTIVRGATGLWRLKNGQPIFNPRTWLF